MTEKIIKGSWSKKEDETLQFLVEKYGAKNWRILSSFIPGRNGKQLRARWNDHLNPHIRVRKLLKYRKKTGLMRKSESLKKSKKNMEISGAIFQSF